MSLDRISSIQVKGIRTVGDVRLELNPFTVLTGTNGSGKSTLIESCEIARSLAEPNFLDEFVKVHGGFDALSTSGQTGISLAVEIDDSQSKLNYFIEIQDVLGLSIAAERLTFETLDEGPIVVLEREGRVSTVLNARGRYEHPEKRVPGSQALLTAFGVFFPNEHIGRTIKALKSIEVHVSFATLPTWVERSLGNKNQTMRISRAELAVDSISMLGLNLANAYQFLRKDRAAWERTLNYVRIGLGEDIEDVYVKTVEGSGLEIFFRYTRFNQAVPARSLSDGTLVYLAYVAMFSLSPRRTLMAFDEPEVHLHPSMVSRVAQLLQAMSEKRTVLVATHSDRFLDAVRDPAATIVFCSLNDSRQTVLRRPDPLVLNEWLSTHGSYGELRSAGLEDLLLR